MYSKKTIHILSILAVFSLIRPNYSAALDIQSFKPYLGLEYSQRSLNMVDGYGKGLFVKRLPQGNAFIGLKLNDYIGIEAGYLFSQAATRTTYLNTGNQILGNLLAPNHFLASENTINLFGSHLNINAFLPISTTGFYGIGSIGVSMLTLKARFKPIGNQAVFAFTPAATEARSRHFLKKKLIKRITGGIGYKITSNFEIRFLTGYETTSHFKKIAPKEASPLRISLKNNTISNLGLTYSF